METPPSTIPRTDASSAASVADNAGEDRRIADRGPPPGMKDRRIASTARRMSPRMKTLKGAMIVTPTGMPTICIVRDFSETGACLEVHSPIPHNVFELVFNDSDGWPSRSCRVMWRKPSRMGVKFE